MTTFEGLLAKIFLHITPEIEIRRTRTGRERKLLLYDNLISATALMMERYSLRPNLGPKVMEHLMVGLVISTERCLAADLDYVITDLEPETLQMVPSDIFLATADTFGKHAMRAMHYYKLADESNLVKDRILAYQYLASVINRMGFPQNFTVREPLANALTTLGYVPLSVD